MAAVTLEDLLRFRVCMRHIHRYSPGVSGHFLRENGDLCAVLGHWGFILNNHVSPDSVSNKALHAACSANHVAAIKTLTDPSSSYACNLLLPDLLGWTPLHTIAVHGSISFAEFPQDAVTDDGVRVSALCEQHQHGWHHDELLGTVNDRRMSTEFLCAQVCRNIALDAPNKVARHLDPIARAAITADSTVHCRRSSLLRVCLELCGDAILETRRTQNLYTLLMLACSRGSVECTQVLLHYGANVHSSDRVYNKQPLHYACQVPDTSLGAECVSLLLRAGANVNATSRFGLTPLMLAARYGTDGRTVQVLLDWNADPRICGGGHSTAALHYACESGNVDSIRRILRANPDMANWATPMGFTPLICACQTDCVDGAKMLLQYGANVNAREEGEQYTALHDACENGATACVRLLLSVDTINVNATTMFGVTPLMLASQTGHTDCVALLLYAENIILESIYPDTMTPLHYASMNGWVACMQLLLDAGANIDARALQTTLEETDIERTPLMLAYCYHCVEAVLLLVERGADVNFTLDPVSPLSEREHAFYCAMQLVQQHRLAGIEALRNLIPPDA